jgi:Uma2 family endonuclease
MPSVVIIAADNVTVPAWVEDRDSFHRWTASEEFPEHGRIDYLQGEIWIDMSEEQVFSHNQVKTAMNAVLFFLAQSSRLGRHFADGLRISHPEADLSAVPDGVFILNDSFQTMRVQLVEGATGGFVRVEGAPDMALEVVSPGSVKKDTVRLHQIYRDAGIPEYWLVDARQEPLTFDVFRLTAKGYVATRKQSGWVKSAVFGKSFRLTQAADALGHPAYTLAVR